MTKSRDLGNLAQTVAVNLPTSLGTAGQSLVVNSGADGLEFGAASGGGVTVYTGLSGTDGTPSGATYLLNASSPSAGDLAYVTANTSLYQYNGYGWYRIAVINTTPTISSVADASSNTTPFTLEGGTNTVITVTASDADEGTDLAYSYSVTSGSLNGTTVTQGTGASENVFTITPHASNATAFSITFSVSDSINAATSVAEFTLQFIVTDSHYTSLLMATDGSAGDNNDDIADATGNHTNNITVSDNPSAGTFSPYRHGGYSNYFDGAGDFLAMADDASFGWGTGSWTFEVWLYITKTGGFNAIFDTRVGTGSETGNFGLGVHTSGKVQMYASPSAFYYPQGSGDVLNFNEWQHLAIVKDASTSTTTMYFNGTAASTTYSDTRNYGASQPVQIGKDDTTSNYFGGYMRDMRVVKGTAVYTGNFTPPTGPLTTTGGEYSSTTNVNTSITASHTSLLTCHLPYFADGSSNDHSITTSGDPETKPIGPYDYQQYSEGTNGGSIEFDGSNDGITIADHADFDLSSGNWTVEFWWNPKSVNTNEGPMSVGYGAGSNPIGLKVSWESDKLYTFSMNGSTLQTGLYHDATAASLIDRWNHIAVVYNGSNTEMYLNGVASGRAQSTNFGENSSDDVRIGSVRRLSSIHYSECSISDVRIVKGTAVYSGAFTPPTGPLTATGGTYPSTTNVDTSITSGHTKLLISGTNAHVIDKSQSTNLTLVNDAAAVTDAPNNSYISSTNALSLDGTGDYVTATGIPIGSGDFTLEAWVRPASFANYRTIFTNRGTANASTNFVLGVNSSGQVYLWSSSFLITSSSSLSANTWHHVALVRNGTGAGSTVLYIDGSSVGSANVSNNFSDTAYDIGGDTVDSNHWNGYIQDLRVSVGKARTISVPSSPLKG